KAFVPLNDTSNHYIESFSPGDIVFLKEKFVGSENFYIVTATSIKVINFEFDDMPVLGINSVVVGITNQTVKNIENDLILEFYIEKKVGDREPPSFWIEARHNANNKYLTNKTNAINQNSHSTTAILIGRNDSTAQSITLPWLSQLSIPGYARANCQPRGAASTTPKKGCSTLSNMGPTSVPQNQTLFTALETNPIPN
ncbi:18788_t:CDS:2, partial [Gigaspora margarita]